MELFLAILLACLLFLFGYLVGRNKFKKYSASGKLIIDYTNPNEDSFKLVINEDINTICSKKKIIFNVENDSRD